MDLLTAWKYIKMEPICQYYRLLTHTVRSLETFGKKVGRFLRPAQIQSMGYLGEGESTTLGVGTIMGVGSTVTCVAAWVGGVGSNTGVGLFFWS